MRYTPRTPVENPYCGQQLATQEPATELYQRINSRRGLCTGCGRYVNVRANGTPKIHRTYGRRAMAQRVAEWKRTGEHI